MIQVKDIRKMYFEEGKSLSEISRITGHDRKTIDLYLKKEGKRQTQGPAGVSRELCKWYNLAMIGA